ncbi:MAG TPA: oligosaccharide flippase family protein [Saprospiraceae bacterium]|nr:oligosaccharide flippase family protein [Saprospiraceae bacterium]HMQ83119.1 oligosaccharide flippase family protein [Saprospiraceae bacterium]
MTKSARKENAYSLLGYASQLGFAFLSFLVLIRLMPEHEFGVWVLFLTLTSFADMGRVGLIQNAVIKFALEQAEEYPKIALSGLLLNTLCSLLLSMLLIGLAWPLSRLWSAPELWSLMWWYPGIALVHGTARYIDFLHMVKRDFKGIFWSKSVYGLLNLLPLAVFWYQQSDISLHQLAAIQFWAGFPSLAFFLFYRRDYLSFGKYSRSWMRQIVHFGKYVLGTNFSSMFFNKVDILMVGTFLNPAAVALYNVATRITNYMEVPMSGISQAVYPRLAAIYQESDLKPLSQMYERSVALLVATLLPMALLVVLFAKPLVVLLAGENYAEAASILNILVFAIMAKPWARLFGITLDAIGKPRLNFTVLLGGLLFNIVLNAFLLNWLGIQGAAWATFISIWAMALVGQWLIQKIIPVNHSNIFKHIVAYYKQPMMRVLTN